MKRNLLSLAFLFVGFFVLYALTAQRGLGWGDSGEFQHWILSRTETICGASFSNAHPLYVELGRLVASSPFSVTLISSFFGAFSVAAFFLCSRHLRLSVAFGFSHMLWWLSCVAEVQTMNLAFTAVETFLLLRFLATQRGGWLVALAFLNGLHLEAHNFALLAIPVYLAVLAVCCRGRRLLWALPIAAAWGAGASFWIRSLISRGAGDVLVGAYGAKVAGVLPENWLVTGFNFALAALSFFGPCAILWWNRHQASETEASPHVRSWPVWALFGTNLIFSIRYFVPDQATFILPTLFFAYLLVSNRSLNRKRLAPLVAMQVLLPVLAWLLLAELPTPEGRTVHPFRDEAAYFALPWKHADDSADRCAALYGGAWTGYPEEAVAKPPSWCGETPHLRRGGVLASPDGSGCATASELKEVVR